MNDMDRSEWWSVIVQTLIMKNTCSSSSWTTYSRLLQLLQILYLRLPLFKQIQNQLQKLTAQRFNIHINQLKLSSSLLESGGPSLKREIWPQTAQLILNRMLASPAIRQNPRSVLTVLWQSSGFGQTATRRGLLALTIPQLQFWDQLRSISTSMRMGSSIQSRSMSTTNSPTSKDSVWCHMPLGRPCSLWLQRSQGNTRNIKSFIM